MSEDNYNGGSGNGSAWKELQAAVLKKAERDGRAEAEANRLAYLRGLSPAERQARYRLGTARTAGTNKPVQEASQVTEENTSTGKLSADQIAALLAEVDAL